jgi:hypothetical protein
VPRPCRFFGTRAGCRHGEACRFAHTSTVRLGEHASPYRESGTRLRSRSRPRQGNRWAQRVQDSLPLDDEEGLMAFTRAEYPNASYQQPKIHDFQRFVTAWRGIVSTPGAERPPQSQPEAHVTSPHLGKTHLSQLGSHVVPTPVCDSRQTITSSTCRSGK